MKTRNLIICSCILALPLAAGTGIAPDAELGRLLETIRQTRRLPALAGAILDGSGIQSIAATGVRKAGTDVAATIDDAWHLGSNTKPMTAFLLGRLVEQGKLKWETTIAEVFPDQAKAMPPAVQEANLLHLLSHRAGLPANIFWGLVPKTGSLRDQRVSVVGMLKDVKPVADLGSRYLYSNLGYVVAGAMAERVMNASWEDLMVELVFKPLGMTSAGFGGLGTPGQVDEPWPHAPDGKPEPMNGPDQDNPAVIGPAGSVHCTLADWAKFVGDVLKGARGEKALLKPETYKTLVTPPFGGDYALGWLVVERDWGGGKVLNHNGSNTMNFATVWIAPAKGFAVLIVTNQGGPEAARGCDEAAGKMIEFSTAGKQTQGNHP